MKLELNCDWCRKKIYKYECRLTPHNFCSKQCLADFSSKTKNKDGYSKLKDYKSMSKNMKELNKKLNPTRMNSKTREKVRNSLLNRGAKKTYRKYYGRHEHRVVAEKMIGRKLKKGEVVHHIDGDKRNNDPNNLMVMESQSEHAKWHVREKRFWSEGGDA